ncbi:hypothetical protein B9Z55_015955 [Caenorhabditis nigoni]|uniref:Uncharacterized protein n=1 Tax=Caenorhabditis nigoni TaxID=1611254 RepID=A0A2G5UCM9_9PELO|nr:hypothetical protein B9Z55_015955 [Caenorhabditis nigoni]
MTFPFFQVSPTVKSKEQKVIQRRSQKMSQKEKKGAGVDLFKVKLEPPSLDSEKFGGIGGTTTVTQGDDKDSTRHTIEVLLDIS